MKVVLSRRKQEEQKETYTAGETLSALKVVVLNDEGEAVLAEPSTFRTSLAIGVTCNAVSSGGQVRVLKEGEIEDSLFNFPDDDLLYLGPSGSITNIPPSSGNYVLLGHSVKPGMIYIRMDSPIEFC